MTRTTKPLKPPSSSIKQNRMFSCLAYEGENVQEDKDEDELSSVQFSSQTTCTGNEITKNHIRALILVDDNNAADDADDARAFTLTCEEEEEQIKHTDCCRGANPSGSSSSSSSSNSAGDGQEPEDAGRRV
ncbi:hypothetical protein CAOG_06917 [Capsaspora owczarzaki ATCC 30864]|uniref:Uncharacterized protein n=1 Tax=Capsaspora owczarzaki (strain ATCC 30864) TaxID=595528 RepID=A0A0D2WW37_CAPO3|nr:hypothetical protein CAOG_06917 [Capsaspora owczarzaki ATCC 30864]KJE96618.1 hypothetical protein CAOG_006917 [Capsaspora owczarzaki ATCC 30864]|eukprot:XP_004344538.1 hypothetical protein CAOG_06917 [Capsaspora owczarzaki ATCC 30864]